MSFVSFFILFLGRGPMEGVNLILIGLGNPLLMVVFLFFGFMSFIFGYLENRKEEQRQLPNAP